MQLTDLTWETLTPCTLSQVSSELLQAAAASQSFWSNSQAKLEMFETCILVHVSTLGEIGHLLPRCTSTLQTKSSLLHNKLAHVISVSTVTVLWTPFSLATQMPNS